ncbi:MULTISPECIES: ead/Ea22-like family protein [Enterobacteriaceae]|uniref:ead/Ea22-like family protein n=1 Tax=Enterobacteriaceae TaxID=543 RepID=UPI001EFCDD1B|nr:ead/Ea22-like family protein [Escherichia coli]MCG9452872.1 ead/Ea22-like family protein [Escherichia coli]HDS4351404.1 ead/Ea22-like family protein [Enterobacter roggenkampii]
MSNIDKQAQYESKFSRLWERYDEASHGNAEQMRDILEVTLDALESAERQILRLEKLAEAESVGADKAAASGVEWMKRCLAAEKLIAELELKLEAADKLQDSAFRHGLQHGFSYGQTDNQAGFEQAIQAYGQQWKGE